MRTGYDMRHAVPDDHSTLGWITNVTQRRVESSSFPSSLFTSFSSLPSFFLFLLFFLFSHPTLSNQASLSILGLLSIFGESEPNRCREMDAKGRS